MYALNAINAKMINTEENHHGKNIIEFDWVITEPLLISREVVPGVKFRKEINLLMCFPFPPNFESRIAGATLMSQLLVISQNSV